MQFEATGSGANLLRQRLLCGGVALAQEAKVDGPVFASLKHSCEVPRSRRTSRGVRASSRPGATSDHCGDSIRYGLVDLLRGDKVDVGINATSSDQQIFAGDHLRARPYDQVLVYAFHGIGIACLADFDNPSILDADITLDDTLVVDDQGIGNHEVEGTMLPRTCGMAALTHAVADDFASAKRDFVTIGGEVLLYLNDQFGICQAYTVPCRWTVQVTVGTARYMQTHALLLPGSSSGPFTRPLCP